MSDMQYIRRTASSEAGRVDRIAMLESAEKER